ncbi:restriction endonuclease subunit S [Streptomyces sp. NPDC055287]
MNAISGSSRARGPRWGRVSLDVVATRGSGHTPNKKRAEYWNGNIPWVSLKDTSRLDRGVISETTESITSAGLANSSAVMHPSGSVVLLRDAGIGKSAVLQGDMAVSQHFMAWNCGPRLDNWFLYYYFQSMKAEFERISNGSTIKTIGLDYFRQLTVPLPDLEEQRLISQVLIDVDGLTASLERVIAKKQAVKDGLMQQLLTGRTRLTGFAGRWQEAALGDVAIVNMGQSPLGSSYNRERRGLPLVQGNADIKNRRTVDRLWTTNPTKRCQRDDIILTVRAPVGYVATASRDVCLGRGVCSVTAGPDNRFIFHALVYAESRWENIQQGSTFTAVNSNEVRSFTIAWPSDRLERHAIASVLDDIDSEIAVLHCRLAKALDLKQGMMQELLMGRTRLSAQRGTTNE